VIISRTPFRISFFGGGSDYPAWYRKYGGKVIGTSIDKYCYLSCRYLPAFFDHKHRIVYSHVEHVKRTSDIKHPAVRALLKLMKITGGVEIHHDGDLPAKSGLGSSSAFTVGLINSLHALRERIVSKRELAVQAVHVEREVLKESVGSQDQVLTAMGGLNVVEFRQDDSFDVTPVILSKAKIELLQKHMMLFFTGFTRVASKIAKSHIKNLESRKRDIQIMQQMVTEAEAILEQKNSSLIQFGHLLDEGWRFKRSSTKGKVTTPQLDAIYDAARKAGAIGGKILGAGGGGFMLLFAEPHHHPKIKERLKRLTYVPFRFDFSGSKIVVFEPNNFQ
jgi:D-glycero-alpha-D-manno-heptose-7-phosphate kinase